MESPSTQPANPSETLAWSGFKKEFDEHKEEVKKLKEDKENLAGEVAELRKLLQNVQEYTKTNSVEEVKDKKKDIVSILKSIADAMRVPSKKAEINQSKTENVESPNSLKRSRTFLISCAPKSSKGTLGNVEKDNTSSPDSKKSSNPSSPECKDTLPTKKRFMRASKKIVKQKKYFQNLGGKSKLPVRRQGTNLERRIPDLQKSQ